jgi:hypothetical protein
MTIMVRKECECGGAWNKRHDDAGNPIWQCGMYDAHTKPRQVRISAKRRRIDALFAELSTITD